MNTKAAVASSLLFLAAPAAHATEPRAHERIVSSSQIPRPALHTLDAQAGRHRIHEYTSRSFPSGGETYLARYHTLTTGDTEVEVTPAGTIVGIYRRLEEPVGTGP